MNIRPIKNRVLVRQEPPQDKIGTLYVPQGLEHYPNFATVVAIGPEVQSELKVGDRVLFKRKPDSALNPDTREGKSEFDDLLVLPEENILAIVE